MVLSKDMQKWLLRRLIFPSFAIAFGLLLILFGFALVVHAEAPSSAEPVDVKHQTVLIGVVSTDGNGSIDPWDPADPSARGINDRSQYTATIGYWPTSAVEGSELDSDLADSYESYVQGFQLYFEYGLGADLPTVYSAGDPLFEVDPLRAMELTPTGIRDFYHITLESNVEDEGYYPGGARFSLYNQYGESIGFGTLWSDQFNILLYGDIGPGDSVYAFPAFGGDRNCWISITTVYGAATLGRYPPAVWYRWQPEFI